MKTYTVTFVTGGTSVFPGDDMLPDASVGGLLVFWDSANNRPVGWVQAANVASIVVTYPA